MQTKMASCVERFDLKATETMQERDDKFWNASVVEMKLSFKRHWIKSVRKPNYGMMNMDGQLEEIVGNNFELAGPILDSYLLEIGKTIKNKLSRSKATSLVNPVSLFFLWPFMNERFQSSSRVRLTTKKFFKSITGI